MDARVDLPDAGVPPPSPARPFRGRGPRRALVVLLVLSLVLAGYVVWPFRGPLFIAAVLAAAFQPPLRRLTRALRGRRRSAGALLTVAVLVGVVAPFATVAGFLTQQVLAGLAFVRDELGVQGVGDLAHAPLPRAANELLARVLGLLHLSRAQLAAHLSGALDWGERAAPGALAASGEVAFHALVLIGAFYFLVLDGPHVVRWVAAVSPLREDQTHDLIEEFRRVAVATLVGTIVAAVFQGVAAGIGYAIFGIPHAAFFGMLTALASFVPVVGTLVVWIPASLGLAAAGHVAAGVGLAAWCVVLVVGAEHVGRPLLMGGGAEMHTGLVFLALLGGLEMFGLIGVLAGPLVIAFFVALARMTERELKAGGVPRVDVARR